ncbi:MAG: proprotein convertase P-domain-containing protein [Deltaproteobacteria bacterium]|nr:proprotein convertase P-domain-containing protein [Deltaproteobacteria bacterium]
MRTKLVSLVLLSVAACAAPTDPAGDLDFPLVDPGSPEEAGMLAFVNDPSTTLSVLDDDVPLNARAAGNIIDRRDGADGVAGTADDELFTSIGDLDSVSYVGPAALEALLAYVRENGWLDVGAVERDVAILALVNHPDTTLELLDLDVGLDVRAATNIIAYRDGADAAVGTADDRLFASIEELDMISYVGPSALDDLAAYALANGYGGTVEPPVGDVPTCALISEVIEGSGNYNKAAEITNCGDTAIDLADLGFCLVRNDDTSCSLSSPVGTGTLAPGEAWVVCRSKDDALSDPFPGLVMRCDQEIGSAASFNGDDRLVLFADTDRDGELGSDPLLDVFGEMARRPGDTIWADAAFRRCDPTPHLAGAFDVATGWTTVELGTASIYDHLGVAPTYDCAAPVAAAEGEDCTREVGCESGLRCQGVPRDGSGMFGKCIPTGNVAGAGESCDRFAPCQDDLICAGWTLWGSGNCEASYNAGRFESDGAIAIPDGGTIEPGIVVYGLASVPVDIEVVAQIDHPRPTDLRLTLVDPNGSEAPLWDREELDGYNRSFATEGAISRDDEVNGEWQLRVEDLVTGETGTLTAWSLFIVSRYD